MTRLIGTSSINLKLFENGNLQTLACGKDDDKMFQSVFYEKF